MTADPATLLATADLPALGSRIHKARRDQGLTQLELAGTDISPTYVSRIEAGQRRPDIRVARLIAARLSTTVEFLVTGMEPSDADEARLAVRYAELALKSGEAADAEAQLRKLQESHEELGPLAGEITWLHALALEALGRLDDAVALLEQLASSPNGATALQASIALSRCYREAGDLAHAIDVGERARRQASDGGLAGTDDDVRLAATLVAAYHERGDVAYAAQLCQQAIRAAELNASPPARAAAYWNASVLAWKRSKYGEAVSLAERALSLLSESEDERSLARLRTLLGLLLLGQDEPDVGAAQLHLARALEDLQTRDGSTVDQARCEIGLAQALLLAGDIEGAMQRASAALETVRSTAPFVAASATVLIGRVAAATGDTIAARGHYREAVALLSAAQSDREAGQLWYELGELLETAGDDLGARDAFRSAAAAAGLRASAKLAVRV